MNDEKRFNVIMEEKKTEKISKASFCLVLASVLFFASAVGLFVLNRHKAQTNDDTPTESSPFLTSAPQAALTEPKTVKEEKTTVGPNDDPFMNPTVITIDRNNPYSTVVNTNYRIPASYEPNLSYVCGTQERLDKTVAKAYEEMFNAAVKDDVYLTPCSGYRSYELQERNYNNLASDYESQGYSKRDALIEAATVIMPPGSSEHNLGFCMDIVCVEEWFEDTDEFKWLTEHADDYGFILRYPADKEDITKVIYEPWHWRYVGVEEAKKIKASGLCLEEYFGKE